MLIMQIPGAGHKTNGKNTVPGGLLLGRQTGQKNRISWLWWGCVPQAPGTHWKEWSLRNGQEGVLGRTRHLLLISSTFLHVDPCSRVRSLFLQVAFSGQAGLRCTGLKWSSVRWKSLRWASPCARRIPSASFSNKIKEYAIAPFFNINFCSEKTCCFLIP